MMVVSPSEWVWFVFIDAVIVDLIEIGLWAIVVTALHRQLKGQHQVISFRTSPPRLVLDGIQSYYINLHKGAPRLRNTETFMTSCQSKWTWTSESIGFSVRRPSRQESRCRNILCWNNRSLQRAKVWVGTVPKSLRTLLCFYGVCWKLHQVCTAYPRNFPVDSDSASRSRYQCSP